MFEKVNELDFFVFEDIRIGKLRFLLVKLRIFIVDRKI